MKNIIILNFLLSEVINNDQLCICVKNNLCIKEEKNCEENLYILIVYIGLITVFCIFLIFILIKIIYFRRTLRKQYLKKNKKLIKSINPKINFGEKYEKNYDYISIENGIKVIKTEKLENINEWDEEVLETYKINSKKTIQIKNSENKDNENIELSDFDN